MLDVTVTYKIIINNFIRHFKNAMSAIYDTIKKILFNNLKMKTQKSEKINIAKKRKRKGNGFTFPDTTGPLEMYRLVYDLHSL